MKYLSFDRLIAITSIGLGVMTLLQPTRSILGFVPFNSQVMALLFILPALYLLYKKSVSYSRFVLCTAALLLYFLLFVFAYIEAALTPELRAPSLAIAWAFWMFYLLIQYVKSEMVEKEAL